MVFGIVHRGMNFEISPETYWMQMTVKHPKSPVILKYQPLQEKSTFSAVEHLESIIIVIRASAGA